jgi:alpha-tubulin suppressor-like RCC1 family protein
VRARHHAFWAVAVVVVACSDATGPASPDVTVDLDAALAVGADVTCAITSDGQGYCWGSDDLGQLGTSANLSDVPQPTAVDRATGLQAISVANATVCNLDRNGVTSCWGGNIPSLGGQLANRSDVPRRVDFTKKFTAISAGTGFACALDETGAAYCWGRNTFGMLGTGDSTAHLTPTAVAGGLRFTAIAAGLVDACALTSDGTAYCWGAGDIAPLAGLSNTGPTPTKVPGSHLFSSISVGGLTVCAIELGTKIAYCWGANFDGKVGDGTLENRALPTPVSGALQFESIRQSRANSTVSHTCGVTVGGLAYCWGGNHRGQVGSASTQTCIVGSVSTPCTLVPTLVQGLTDVVRVDAGLDHTCALTKQHEIRCWGDNSNGELGDGTLQASTTPVLVKGGLRFP